MNTEFIVHPKVQHYGLTTCNLGAMGVARAETLQAACRAPDVHRGEGGELMPAFLIGHGRPLSAIEDNRFTRGWTGAMKDVPPPRAILCISAHWRMRGTYVTAISRPRTIHDHGDASRELRLVRYPAPGTPRWRPRSPPRSGRLRSCRSMAGAWITGRGPACATRSQTPTCRCCN